MGDYLVKDVMVPLSEYATVNKGATLFEAVLALEKAQEEYDHTKYRHRGVMVLDAEERVVGKLGQLDVLRALEPLDDDLTEIKDLGTFGFSDSFIHELRVKRQMGQGSLRELCKDTAKLRVEDIMQAPSQEEIIGQEKPLDTAINQLVMGHHLALLVTDDDANIIGILRLTDVFAAVFHVMKECESEL